jgi:hypothetical protein
VWHRDPAGRRPICVDGLRLDTACPRYYGPACYCTGYAQIGLICDGPATRRVIMDSPALEWTLTATSTLPLSILNTIGGAMPLTTWRLRSLSRARVRLASALGMGRLQLTGTMPSGHTGTLMPKVSGVLHRHLTRHHGRRGPRPSSSPAGRPHHRRGRPARTRRPPHKPGNWEILDPAVGYDRTRSQTATAAQRLNGGG